MLLPQVHVSHVQCPCLSFAAALSGGSAYTYQTLDLTLQNVQAALADWKSYIQLGYILVKGQKDKVCTKWAGQFSEYAKRALTSHMRSILYGFTNHSSNKLQTHLVIQYH